jgi:hypothetical protein
MSNVKVAILVPPEDPEAPADEADTFVQAREIHQCITMLGNDPLTVVFGPDRAATADALRRHRPDVVVNLVEDLPEGPDQVFCVTECLDRLGLPYTGAGTRALRAAPSGAGPGWPNSSSTGASSTSRSSRRPKAPWCCTSACR